MTSFTNTPRKASKPLKSIEIEKLKYNLLNILSSPDRSSGPIRGEKSILITERSYAHNQSVIIELHKKWEKKFHTAH